MGDHLAVGGWAVARGHPGRVRYLGPVDFAEGEWCGVELFSAVGRNDGSVRGARYFTCKPRHGLLVRPANVEAITEDEARALLDAAGGDADAIAASWSAMENVLESEALQAGRDAERVVEHLTKQHPKPAGSTGAQAAARARAGTKLQTRRQSSARLKTVAGADSEMGAFAAGLSIPGEYAGPRWEGAPTGETMLVLLKHVKNHVGADRPGPAVPHKLAMQLMLLTKEHLEQQPKNVTEIKMEKGRLVIVGDTHGQLADFCWLLRSHGTPAKGNVYVINGDVADRGRHAVEIFLLIFGFMLAAPGTIYLNRGNHESHDMNVRGFNEGGGFASEVGQKYGSEAYSLFQLLFNRLPIATVVNSEVLIVHGGLCRNGATLDQIRKIKSRRPVPVSPNNPDDVLFFDLMWADPRAAGGIGLSAVRGAGCCTFGPDITRRFCEVNRLRMVIRSHEVPKSLTGVQVLHDGRLVTVFSASNYCGRIGNTGGTMLLTPELNYQAPAEIARRCVARAAPPRPQPLPRARAARS